MARRCEICGKGTTTGHNVPRKGQPKKQGGAGQHIGVRTLRKFKANIVSVKTLLDGTVSHVKVCTSCLKANKVAKV
jgi:large subunit ribosomal protein L28